MLAFSFFASSSSTLFLSSFSFFSEAFWLLFIFFSSGFSLVLFSLSLLFASLFLSLSGSSIFIYSASSVYTFYFTLFSSVLLSDITVWLYIVAECNRVGLLNVTYISGFALFELFLIAVQYTYYQIAKSYLVKKTVNGKEYQ